MKPKFKDMTKGELYSHAQKYGIPGRSKMTKAALLEALADVVEGDASPATGGSSLDLQAVQAEAAMRVRADESTTITSPRPAPSAPQYMTPVPAADYVGEEGPPLPGRLPATTLEAMPRDPHWIFLYWEISEEDEERIRSEHGDWVFHHGLSILRVYELNTDTKRDIPILLDSRNWYLPTKPDHEYRFELGLVMANGQFIPIAASGSVHMPAVQPSFEDQEEWLAIEERYRKLADIYGEFAPGTIGGSVSGHRAVRREGRRIGWSGALPTNPSSVQEQ